MILSRLIYFSKPSGVGDADIADILAVSRANNYADNISGVLFYNGSHFIQMLEGGRRALTRRFSAIARDRRHIDVTLTEFIPIDVRHFADWGMGYIGAEPGHEAILRRYATGAFNPATIAAPGALASLLVELANTLPDHVTEI